MSLIIGLLLAAALLLTSALYRGVLFNPLVVFFGTLLLPFALFDLDKTYFHYFHFDAGLSAYGAWVTLGSLLAFLLGSFIPAVSRSARVLPFQGMGNREAKFLLRVAVFLLAVVWLGIIGEYVILTERFGNPFQNLGAIRYLSVSGQLTFPPVIILATSLSYVVILNLGVLVVIRRSARVWLLVLSTFAGTWLDDASVAGRGSSTNCLLLFVSAALMTMVVCQKRVNLRRYAAYFVGAIVLLNFILAIAYLRSDRSVGLVRRIAGDSVIYLSGTVPAFSYFLEQPWPARLPGLWTLGGLYKGLDMAAGFVGLRLFEPTDLHQTFYAPITSTGPFNSSLYLTYLHSDFGVWGTIIGSWLIGFVASHLFFKCLTRGRVLDVQVLALVYAGLLLSGRGVISNGPFFWVTLGLIALQGLVIYRRRPATQLMVRELVRRHA